MHVVEVATYYFILLGGGGGDRRLLALWCGWYQTTSHNLYLCFLKQKGRRTNIRNHIEAQLSSVFSTYN